MTKSKMPKTTATGPQRRQVLRGIAGGLIAAPWIVSSKGAFAEGESVTFKVSLFTPPTSDNNKLMRRIEKQLLADSNGRIKLDFYEASQMGSAPRQFDLVRTGVADISIMLCGLAPGRFPLLGMLDLAGVVDEGVSPEVAVPATSAALDLRDKYLTKEMAGVKLLNIAVLPNPIVIARKPVTKIADLKNMRIRHPGAAHAAMLERLGAVPTAVQSNEMAEALSRGVVDGVLTGYTGVEVFHLNDSAKNILELPSGGMTFICPMNQNAYDRLPADLRSAFDKSFGPQNQKAWAEHLAIGEVEARDRMRSGLSIHALDSDDAVAFRKIAAELRVKAAKDLDAKGIPGTEFLSAVMERAKAYR